MGGGVGASSNALGADLELFDAVVGRDHLLEVHKQLVALCRARRRRLRRRPAHAAARARAQIRARALARALRRSCWRKAARFSTSSTAAVASPSSPSDTASQGVRRSHVALGRGLGVPVVRSQPQHVNRARGSRE